MVNLPNPFIRHSIFNNTINYMEILNSKRLYSLSSNPSTYFSSPRKWEITPFGKIFNKNNLKNRYSEITVMSYNVLAQYLLTTNMYLYAPCKLENLEWNYRKYNLLFEIKQMNADILCLQEIQADHYMNFFYPELLKLGYDGVYKKRTRTKYDGCATFYKKEKFGLGRVQYVEYLKPRHVCRLLDRDNVALILTLTIKKAFANSTNNATACRVKKLKQTKEGSGGYQGSTAGNIICVANTHLLFNPKRDDVRLIQCHILMAEIEKMARRFEPLCKTNQETPEYMPIILCGDFNLTPTNPIYREFIRPCPTTKLHSPENYKLSVPTANTANSNQNYSLAGDHLSSPNSRILSPWELTSITKALQTDQYSTFQSMTALSYSNLNISDLSHRFKLYSVYGHYLELKINNKNDKPTNSTRNNKSETASRCVNTVPEIVPEVTTKNGVTGFTVDYIFYNSFGEKYPNYLNSLLTTTSTTSKTSNPNNLAKLKQNWSSPNLNSQQHPCKSAGQSTELTPHLKLLARYKLVSEDDVLTRLGGCLPNQYISSDHLCLGAKFAIIDSII